MGRHLRIAIFDYQVVRSNPIGGCHRRLLNSLCGEHDFTVFSVEFDNPCPERIKWVRVPAPIRPLPLLFVSYHLIAPIVFALYTLRSGQSFDLVQTVESKLSFGDVAYSHFCHTSYLKHHWANTRSHGFRGISRWLDHFLHARLEGSIYRRVKQVLVPSKGLGMELADEFPMAASKIQVLPNAIDVDGLSRPVEFDSAEYRKQLNLSAQDVVFVFAALGHFERKGLPLLMEALSKVESKRAKLLVVGGTNDLVEAYRMRAAAMGVGDRVVFVGMKAEIRPYLWCSDAFVLASNYETFSLVAFEAAAARLPLITPSLHGIEEIVRDGETGFVVERTVGDFAWAMGRFLDLPAAKRSEMGDRARVSVLQYDDTHFADNWRRFYWEWFAQADRTGISHSPAQSARLD